MQYEIEKSIRTVCAVPKPKFKGCFCKKLVVVDKILTPKIVDQDSF